MEIKNLYFIKSRLSITYDSNTFTVPSYVDDFLKEEEYFNTFNLQISNISMLPEQYHNLDAKLILCTTDRFDLYDYSDKWVFAENTNENGKNSVLVCERNYESMVLYMANDYFPLASLIRVACESGITRHDGLPLHASMIEKNGEGIVFLGPSGMGKSTQAKLWVKYEDAEFVIGDRPGIRKVDGKWYGFGMPWDGKDGLFKQKNVPIRALVSLEQTKENHLRKLNSIEAMKVMLNQVMMPMWDKDAMEDNSKMMWELASEIDFYHLQNRADENSVQILKDELGKCIGK